MIYSVPIVTASIGGPPSSDLGSVQVNHHHGLYLIKGFLILCELMMNMMKLMNSYSKWYN